MVQNDNLLVKSDFYLKIQDLCSKMMEHTANKDGYLYIMTVCTNLTNLANLISNDPKPAGGTRTIPLQSASLICNFSLQNFLRLPHAKKKIKK